MLYLYSFGMTMASIAREIGVSACYPYSESHQRRRVIRRNRLSLDINVGCGYRTLGQYMRNDRQMLNGDTRVSRSKRRSYQAFAEAGISCPVYSLDPEQLVTRYFEPRFHTGKVLGREDYNRSGRGIVRYDSAAEAIRGNHDFYTLEMRRHREMRVHVWEGEIIACQLKRIPADFSGVAASHEAGCTYEYRPTLRQYLRAEECDGAYQMAINAVAAVGLDFGAVDLFLDVNRILYVLEVNSAPGLDTEGPRTAYKNAISAYIEA